MEQLKLRLVAEEAGFIHGQVLKQRSQFRFSFMAGEQPVIAVERVQPALLQPAMKTVLKEMGAALIKIHAAFLVDQGLQQLEFGFSNLNWNA